MRKAIRDKGVLRTARKGTAFAAKAVEHTRQRHCLTLMFSAVFLLISALDSARTSSCKTPTQAPKVARHVAQHAAVLDGPRQVSHPVVPERLFFFLLRSVRFPGFRPLCPRGGRGALYLLGLELLVRRSHRGRQQLDLLGQLRSQQHRNEQQRSAGREQSQQSAPCKLSSRSSGCPPTLPFAPVSTLSLPSRLRTLSIAIMAESFARETCGQRHDTIGIQMRQ